MTDVVNVENVATTFFQIPLPLNMNRSVLHGDTNPYLEPSLLSYDLNQCRDLSNTISFPIPTLLVFNAQMGRGGVIPPLRPDSFLVNVGMHQVVLF